MVTNVSRDEYGMPEYSPPHPSNGQLFLCTRAFSGLPFAPYCIRRADVSGNDSLCVANGHPGCAKRRRNVTGVWSYPWPFEKNKISKLVFFCIFASIRIT